MLHILAQQPLLAAAEKSASADSTHHFGIIFVMLAVVLIAGKLGNIVEKFGQPAVIGELFAGIILSGLGYFGWHLIPSIAENEVIAFISSLGAVLLLFAIGLETRIADMKRVGVSAALVALIGVVVPFAVGTFLLGPILLPDADQNTLLFIGAALVATSVGITASVFKSLKISGKRSAKTVLGAAVIDDVLGLIVLAVVSALVSGGNVSTGLVLTMGAKAFGFLAGSLLIGSLLAKPISNLFSRIHTGVGMKVALATGTAFLFAYLAEVAGLEPIIGAFAAGLLLEAVHFKSFDTPEVVHDLKAVLADTKAEAEQANRIIRKYQETHVEELVNTIGLIFIPIFFVFTGLQINFASLLDPSLYLIAGLLSAGAIAGKIVAGFAAKGDFREKMLVGVSMVPRGEVGLIFAATGKSLGAINDQVFSVIVLTVVITTFVAPPLIKKYAHPDSASEKAKLELKHA